MKYKLNEIGEKQVTKKTIGTIFMCGAVLVALACFLAITGSNQEPKPKIAWKQRVVKTYGGHVLSAEQFERIMYTAISFPDSIAAEDIQQEFEEQFGWSRVSSRSKIPHASEYPGWFLPSRIATLEWVVYHESSKTAVWYDPNLHALLVVEQLQR